MIDLNTLGEECPKCREAAYGICKILDESELLSSLSLI